MIIHHGALTDYPPLSKSIVAAREAMGIDTSEETAGAWIKNNADRVNFHLNEKFGIRVLSLFESYLQCRLKPMFEGFESQK
jgi:hypothetical protein